MKSPLLVVTVLVVLASCGRDGDGGGDGSVASDSAEGAVDSGGEDGGGAGTDAMIDVAACTSVCGRTTFDCNQPGGITGTAAITAATPDGCSGSIMVPGEAPPLWVHCDRGEICVEHEAECFPATFTADSFTYTIPGRAPIACVAR